MSGHRLVGSVKKLYVDVGVQGVGVSTALLNAFVRECSLLPCL